MCYLCTQNKKPTKQDTHTHIFSTQKKCLFSRWIWISVLLAWWHSKMATEKPVEKWSICLFWGKIDTDKYEVSFSLSFPMDIFRGKIDYLECVYVYVMYVCGHFFQLTSSPYRFRPSFFVWGFTYSVWIGFTSSYWFWLRTISNLNCDHFSYSLFLSHARTHTHIWFLALLK